MGDKAGLKWLCFAHLGYENDHFSTHFKMLTTTIAYGYMKMALPENGFVFIFPNIFCSDFDRHGFLRLLVYNYM